FRADQIGGLWRELRGQQNPKSELGVARISKGKLWLQCRFNVPCGEPAETVRNIFDSDLGAQPIKTELVGKRLRQHLGAIDQEAAAMSGRRLGDQEIDHDLALRRQQRAEAAQ